MVKAEIIIDHSLQETQISYPKSLQQMMSVMLLVLLLIGCSAPAATSAPPTATLTPIPPTATSTRTPTRIPTRTPTATPVPPTATPDLAATRVQRQREATATAVAAIQATAVAHSSWPLVLLDTFDADVHGWPLGSYSDQHSTKNLSLTDGKYRCDVRAERGTLLTANPNVDPVSDFYLSVEVKRVSGPQAIDYGIVFRKAGDNFYFFDVNDDLWFSLSLLYNGEWTTLLEPTWTSVIQPGQVNRLTVSVEGSHFTMVAMSPRQMMGD